MFYVYVSLNNQKSCSTYVLQLIKEIMAAVTIPVMAKARVGHFAEAQILQALGVDMIDESEGMGNTLDQQLLSCYLISLILTFSLILTHSLLL